MQLLPLSGVEISDQILAHEEKAHLGQILILVTKTYSFAMFPRYGVRYTANISRLDLQTHDIFKTVRTRVSTVSIASMSVPRTTVGG
jgi:hypothetical protein